MPATTHLGGSYGTMAEIRYDADPPRSQGCAVNSKSEAAHCFANKKATADLATNKMERMETKTADLLEL